jgi:hypothetical protein
VSKPILAFAQNIHSLGIYNNISTPYSLQKGPCGAEIPQSDGDSRLEPCGSGCKIILDLQGGDDIIPK